jgi:hypothetical protein
MRRTRRAAGGRGTENGEASRGNRTVETLHKVKCWAESALVLIGTELDKRSGAPVALLARQSAEGLSYTAEPSSPSKKPSGAPYAIGDSVSTPTARPSQGTVSATLSG